MANKLQSTHQQLEKKLHQIKAMIQAMYMKYSAAPQHSNQDFGGGGYHIIKTNYHRQGGHSA